MRTDIKINVDTDFDLLIQNEDFVIEDSDYQNVNILLRVTKGEIRQYPLVGIGIEYMRSAPIDDDYRKKMADGLKIDGYRAKLIFESDGNLKIDLIK